jgi:hypothetical protein
MTEDRPSLQYRVIDELPEFSGRKGPRDSECLRAYIAAREAPTKTIEVIGAPPQLEKFYRSMVQWRNRHKDEPVQVRKDGYRVFVWIEEHGPEDRLEGDSSASGQL